jgi:hypothetical protein
MEKPGRTLVRFDRFFQELVQNQASFGTNSDIKKYEPVPGLIKRRGEKESLLRGNVRIPARVPLATCRACVFYTIVRRSDKLPGIVLLLIVLNFPN